MSVDHRGTDIRVPQKLLHRPDVVPALQKMGRKAVPQGMTGGPLGDPRPADRRRHRPLDH